MKLMDIETDTLGIPDTDYDAKVYMPSAEFQRIVRDLTQLGESVRIDVSKEGVRFSSDGESANGSVLLKQTDAARNQFKREQEKEKEQARKAAKKEKAGKKKDDDEEMEEDDGGEIQEDGDEEKVKEEEEKDEEEKSDDDAEPEEEEDEDEDGETGKKRKRNGAGGGKGKKKAKKGEEEESQGGVSIQMSQSVQLSFSLKYLVNFAKSAGLSSHVELMMSPDVPLLVSWADLVCLFRLLMSHFVGQVQIRAGIDPILPRSQNWRRLNIYYHITASLYHQPPYFHICLLHPVCQRSMKKLKLQQMHRFEK